MIQHSSIMALRDELENKISGVFNAIPVYLDQVPKGAKRFVAILVTSPRRVTSSGGNMSFAAKIACQEEKADEAYQLAEAVCNCLDILAVTGDERPEYQGQHDGCSVYGWDTQITTQ